MTSSEVRRGAFTLACLLAAGTASAQPAKPSQAEIVFREGREAVSRGDMATACAKFEESVKLSRAPGPLLNFADCEERSGRLLSARKVWREGMEQLPPGDERLAVAKRRAEQLEEKIPKLSIRISPATKDARIEVDGAPAEAEALVDPGSHDIVVKAGEQTGKTSVSVAIGERKEVTVSLGGEGNGKPVSKPNPALRTAGLVVGGVGVLGLAAFGVTAGLIQGHRGTVAESCNAEKLCTPEGLAAVESGKTLTPLNTAALVVGAVGVTVGVTLFLLGSSSSSSSKPTAALRTIGGPGGFSTSIVGTF